MNKPPVPRIAGKSCCPPPRSEPKPWRSMTRRSFLERLGGAAAFGAALSRLTWPELRAAGLRDTTGLLRRPLKVKPILIYEIPKRRPQTSWRSWGGIQTKQQAEAEMGRIRNELGRLRAEADFPVEFLPVASARTGSDLSSLQDLASADAVVVYAAGGWLEIFDALAKFQKDTVFFCRHRSGPVYLWYEIISPRYLRRHTDTLAVNGVNDDDVVIDSQEEILWRLRSLGGLRNTLGTRILAVGGPSAWAQPEGIVPGRVENIWKFDIRTVSYDDLGKIIQEARADSAAAARARREAGAYLGAGAVTLETDRRFVDNAFLLEQVFRGLMEKAGCRAITINGCMGTIMPLAETSACLTLSLLNDSGYLAFCESDFVVIPAGVLLANISGKPVFLNDPTYPHEGIITLAHCTAPRRMDGKRLEPARLLTHFESDYGAAPKVEMRLGQVVTNVVPDFAFRRWVGLRGEIAAAPFLDICRSQIEVRFACDSGVLAERMPGFHWMTGYGDYRREIGYALRRVGIEWDCPT
jgi:hypothetical protein